jgi:hypothetical protein
LDLLFAAVAFGLGAALEVLEAGLGLAAAYIFKQKN